MKDDHEVAVEEVTASTNAEVLRYDFDSGEQGWIFMGSIPPYDEALSDVAGGMLSLNPDGSANAFSYWQSPDVAITDGTLYRARFEVGSSCTNADDAVQFRVRVNQKGSWQAWDRGVNSNNAQAPSAATTNPYDVIFNPNVTGSSDGLAIFSFDILSFDYFDDTTSWINLDTFTLEQITSSP